MPVEIVPSVCPHDCPSTCALEVERIDDHTIGRVRGARDNPYTAGIICAKTGRYGERVHHPDRLKVPHRRLNAEHPGFAMGAWELIDWTLRASGLPDAETLARQRWIDCALPFERAHFLDGFATPDRRFHFTPDWTRLGPTFAGMPCFPDHFDVIDNATPARPFRLVTPPARQFLNTTFTETPTSRAREGRPTALIHPADCAALGLTEGSRARIGNERGSVVVHARPFDGLQPGVLVVEGI